MPTTANLAATQPEPVTQSGEANGPAERQQLFWGAVPNCLPGRARESIRFHFSPAGCALFVALAVFFVHLSQRPLWHTDLWGHLAYGRWIATTGAIPSTEPLMPLCRGVPFVDFSWLGEIVAYVAYGWRGAPALQFLYAGSITACVGLLAWCSWRKTGSAGAAALAAATFLWVDWQQFAIARPQLAGCVCFLALFAILTRRPPDFAAGLLVTALFAAWVNLHGSFLIGLALLVAFVCGRAGDVLRRTSSLRAVRHDVRVRRGAVLLILAVAATNLNPYGWKIYEAAWQLSSNANLADLVEWQPVRLWMWQGRAALAVSLGLLALYACTPRRISTTELLLLIGFGAATLATSRMIVWWGPIAAYYASVHAAAIWVRVLRRRGLSDGRREVSSQSVAEPKHAGNGIPARFAGLTACVALVCTPLAGVLPRRPMTDPPGSLSSETPIDATSFLRARAPRGQIFNTMEWGDYLLWAGPPGLEVFVASHAHLVPRAAWQDYIRVITLDGSWRQILERRRVNTVVVDDDQHAALADALREDPAWSVAYENSQALILVRRRPL